MPDMDDRSRGIDTELHDELVTAFETLLEIFSVDNTRNSLSEEVVDRGISHRLIFIQFFTDKIDSIFF